MPCRRRLERGGLGTTGLGHERLQSQPGSLFPDLRGTHFVDVRQNTTTSNGGSDEEIELLVTSDGELKVSRGDTLDTEILGGVACGWSGRASLVSAA
jgi:hypothetical protein